MEKLGIDIFIRYQSEVSTGYDTIVFDKTSS